MSEKPENLEHLDPVWARIRAEAGEIAKREPVMSGFVHTTVLNHDRLETVIASHLAEKMGNAEIGARALGEVFEGADIIDVLRGGYDADTVQERFLIYGEAGRILYARANLSLDVFYPLAYSTFFACLIVMGW